MPKFNAQDIMAALAVWIKLVDFHRQTLDQSINSSKLLSVGISTCKLAVPFRDRKLLLMLARFLNFRSGARSDTSSHFESHAQFLLMLRTNRLETFTVFVALKLRGIVLNTASTKGNDNSSNKNMKITNKTEIKICDC